ncbi:MAG TPA: hypothetical protein VGH28_32610 [Polyangiaceae bacterium]
MTPEEREALVAAVTTAHRERGPRGEIRGHRAFYDLDEAARIEAFDETLRQRALEAATDAQGLSSTARAVLARIR